MGPSDQPDRVVQGELIVVRDIPFVSQALAQSGWYRGDTVPVTIRGIDECPSCRWEALPVVVRDY